MAKKNKKKRSPETPPMPSLIFHEGSLENDESSPTPNADIIEKELRDAPKPPSLSHLVNYSHSAHRLMWIGVTFITLVVCVMWGYSIYAQFSALKMSVSSEANFVETTKKNWQNAFYAENGRTRTASEQVNEIRTNLTKLIAGAASSSTTTSTPRASSTP